MLLFVMPYHSAEERERFQLILERWNELVKMEMPFSFLYVGPSAGPISARFPHACLFHDDVKPLKRFQHIAQKWADVAEYVQHNVDCRCWFWWEPDVLPVKKDCFEFLLHFWGGQTEIMGYHVKDNKWGMKNCINGVAFYSKRYWSYIRPRFNLNGTFDTRKQFDPDTENDRFVALNKWYALVHHEKRLRLTPSLRLVHGIKDSSLLDQLLHGTRRFPCVPDLYRDTRNRLRLLSLAVRPWSLPKAES
ncbi:MAG: hypothetical protein FJ395_15050 [Verrucomicrobia bacterium]|nr:hypothetical protein [Verrucomicrobiota bacterium]